MENAQGSSTIDSTSLAACGPKRISLYRVFKKTAQRGKTAKGWFYRFKFHLWVNEQGELLNFFVSPGNTSDLSTFPTLTEGIFGKLFGDKGYILK